MGCWTIWTYYKNDKWWETWTHQISNLSLELNDVEFINENDGWIVGLGGVILHTTNGGTNWFVQGSNTSNDLFSASFYNQNIGWVAGDNGLVLTTENGGGPPSCRTRLFLCKL